MAKPNILLVMADQLTAMALSAYGNTVCRTPEIDRLAAQGTVFESAYCTYPLCAPSRFSLMSGRLPSRIGAFDNAAEFPAAVPTFAHYLRNAGYYTCISGKMHFVGPDQHHGYEDRLTTEIYPADFSWVPPRTYDEMDDPGRPAQGGPAPGVSSVETIADAGPMARCLQVDYDDEVARRATQHIFDWRRYGDGRPLFMTVSFTQPHDPYVTSAEFWDLYTDAGIDAPRVPPIALDAMDPHSRGLFYHYSLDKFDVTETIYRRARRGYYAMISYVDRKLGELRAALEAAGIADDTAIIFTSDHGDMIGERGLWFKKNLFDPAVAVPLVLYRPGRTVLSRVAAPVSLVDILPTLVDLATGSEAAIVTEYEGSSLLPLTLRDEPDRVVRAEHLDGATLAPRVMLRRGRHKIVVSDAYPPQLYDLHADPGETVDLIADPDLAHVRDELLSLVRQAWDLPALHRQVVASQRVRQFLAASLQCGKPLFWEHYPNPMRDHTRLIRRGDGFPQVERRSYLPYSD